MSASPSWWKMSINYLIFAPFAWCIIFLTYPTLAVDQRSSLPSTTPTMVEFSLPSEIQISYTCGSTNAEPLYQGLRISRWIQTQARLNTNSLSLAKLLTLKQVGSQDENDVVTFELPINYNVLTNNFWSIDLGVINKDGEFALCELYDCERATNGNCLLCWNTSYDPPKKFNLRARLDCNGLKLGWNSITIMGPPLPFVSTNDFQFYEGASMFDSNSLPLVAKVFRPVASFKIEITTPEGKHLKTITGTTTNGMISLEWNLIGDDGKIFEGESVETLFELTDPDKSPTNTPTQNQSN